MLGLFLHGLEMDHDNQLVAQAADGDENQLHWQKGEDTSKSTRFRRLGGFQAPPEAAQEAVEDTEHHPDLY